MRDLNWVSVYVGKWEGRRIQNIKESKFAKLSRLQGVRERVENNFKILVGEKKIMFLLPVFIGQTKASQEQQERYRKPNQLLSFVSKNCKGTLLEWNMALFSVIVCLQLDSLR